MTSEEKKLLQAKHRLEEAQARDRVKERKARTRRLIQEGAVPVSYTHLDVYKRQVLYSRKERKYKTSLCSSLSSSTMRETKASAVRLCIS